VESVFSRTVLKAVPPELTMSDAFSKTAESKQTPCLPPKLLFYELIFKFYSCDTLPELKVVCISSVALNFDQFMNVFCC
jgi:hypothetical protein